MTPSNFATAIAIAAIVGARAVDPPALIHNPSS